MSGDDRYARQELFAEIRAAGQARIGASTVAVVGVGALGCQEATLLARAGVGRLVLVDRDFVERSNLQRQILFDERDAAGGAPKAEAARAHLARANGSIAIEARVTDLTAANADDVLSGCDCIVDGTDNFPARYLMNDWSVRRGVPWIYAAAVGASGLFMPVLPRTTACLRCLFEEPPPPGSAETCDTAGVLAPVTSVIGALAALEALKVVAGRADAVRRGLLQVDLWRNDVRAIDSGQPRVDCPCCGRGDFPFLESSTDGAATSLCGRDAVQVTPPRGAPFDFEAVRARLRQAVQVDDNEYLLRFAAGSLHVTLFKDGRAIVKGTAEPAQARAVYARFVGA